jgi:MoxR-like ATPase
VFTNIVLADEINRAPAKVQSALLEAMAEKQVTIGDTTWPLPSPFFVLATQNPIEQEGTFNLPEAELDRFLLKLTVPYPSPEEELEIVRSSGSPDRGELQRLLDPAKLEQFRQTAESITCSEAIIGYIVSIITATRPAPGRPVRKNEDILRYISFGASPRAGIALHKCAKISALFAGRTFVLPEDVKAVAHQVLRHRLVLSYEAGADGLTADDLITRFLSLIPVP